MQKISMCPVCMKRVVINILIDSGKKDKADWFQCQCGCWFKDNPGINKDYFDEKYKTEFGKGRGIKELLAYQRRVYMPLITELTMGRTLLEVGYTLPLNIEAWREDGWVAEGIDLIKDENKNTIVGDFETYEFQKQYDVIWAANVLQNFINPIGALIKLNNLLKPNGVMFLSTPAPELIHELGYRHWGCWNNKSDNVYFSQKNMVRILENIGLDVILKTTNIQPRFNVWNNNHFIVQRIYALNGGGKSNGEENNDSVIKEGLQQM